MPKIKSSWLLASAMLVASPFAHASKAEKAEALYQQMDAASQRYREAQVRLQNDDETALAAMGKALEDLEDIATQCLKQRGCEAARVITTYETLLKTHDMGPQNTMVGEDDDDVAEPDHVALSSASPSTSPLLQGSVQAQKSLSLLPDGHQFDSMVEFNQPVQAAIRDWLTSQRAFLIDAWENYQYMRYLMWPEYEKAGLPEALLFGIMAKESGGKVHSISHSGASGPLQFMYATGSRFGLSRDETGFDTRFDPQMAARANAAYINERFGELNRNLEYTVAAYNGGEGRALKLFTQYGGQSFWSPQVYAQMPPETRDYVPAVIAAAWLFLHPKKYGLQFPKIDTTPDQFALVRDTSINELTICLGNGGTHDGWFRVLRNLNPRYEAQTLIPAGTMLRAPKHLTESYHDNCIQGPRAEMAAELMKANKAVDMPEYAAATAAYSPEPAPTPVSKSRSSSRKKSHRVRRGDNLVAIAREYSCDLTVLAKANRLKGPGYHISPGQKLKLTGCEG
jgi:membrane-bound lytic murein transglycosylase D